MNIRHIIAIACAPILAACATPQPGPPPGTIVIDTSVGPGPELASGQEAGALFARICFADAVNRAGVIAGLPFTQNPGSGTYYHDRYNLSVSLRPERCSMVFATDQANDSVVSGLARGTTSVTTDVPPGINISSRDGPDGLTYFRMGL